VLFSFQSSTDLYTSETASIHEVLHVFLRFFIILFWLIWLWF